MPSLQRYCSKAPFLFSVALFCGCTRSPDADSWTTHSLTEVQEKRQDELLNEIRWLISARDDLAGKPAADFAELLSLADKTKIEGNQTIHAYQVLAGGGGDHEPTEAKIIVADDKIVSANWPYGEF